MLKKLVVVAAVPVAVLKVSEVKFPEGPETSAPVMVEPERVPPVITFEIVTDLLSASALDCLVTVW